MREKQVNNPEAQKLKSYPFFDWLRLVLASIVVLGHADFQFLPFITGNLAVNVFFALSGWLIGSILLKTDRDELPRFFFNRATRIWIPYSLAIVLLYAVAAFKEGVGYYWLKYLILDITFTHQLFTFFPAALAEMPMAGSGNQFWSIAVEEQFYLLAPIIMIFAPRGRSPLLWAAIVVGTAVAGVNALPISLGVLGAILHSQTGFADRRRWRWVGLAVAVVCAIAMSTGMTEHILSGVFAISVVIACARPGARGPWGVAFGGLSFPLYLNHWIGVFAVHAVEKRVMPFSQTTFVVTQYILNIAVAYALYWAMDRNIQRYRDRWYSRAVGTRLAVMAYLLVAIGLVAGTLMTRYGPAGG